MEKKESGKGTPDQSLQHTPVQLPPEKKKRKEKEPVALTADLTNGSSSDVTPSKKKVTYKMSFHDEI